MEKTLLYHYTSLSHLIEIFKVGKVLTSQTEKMLKVKKPGLWFSTNSEWEYSAFKRFNDGKKEFDLNSPEDFEKYIGCARLITNLNSLFVTFAKYKHKSKVNPLLWDKMAEIGRSKGADPSQWYATFSPMSINNLDIEVYENGKWLKLKKENGEFDSELFNRNLEKTFVYKRGKEMEEKMMKDVESQNLNQDNIKNQVVEEKRRRGSRRGSRGESRRGSRGESRRGSRGESRRGSRGESRRGSRGESRRGCRGESRRGCRGESRRGSRGKSRRGSRGKLEEKTQSKGIFSKIKNLFKK